MEAPQRDQAMEYVQNAEVVILSKPLALGKEGEHQIKSPVTTPEQMQNLFETGRQNIVKVTNRKCAVCIDGRCARCTAKDIVNGFIPEKPKKPELYAKLPGGLLHHATMMTVAGGWAPVAHAETFNEAREIVRQHLELLGYTDALHTSITAVDDPDKTECAAKDKAEQAAREAVVLEDRRVATGESSPITDALAIMWGADDATTFAANNPAFSAVQSNLRNATDPERNFFAGYSSTKERDDLMRSDPERVEILESSADHPTHLHEEEGIAINEIDGTTLDRDALGGRLFDYERWLGRQLAHDLAGTEEEATRLLMASDYVTLDVAHAIVAPGMPVGIYKQAA